MNRLFLVVGPSGTGKTTLVAKLKMHGIPEVVSLTTRKPRPGEVPGVTYHYVERSAFEALREAGEMVEWVEYNGNLYGSTRAEVAECLERGRGCATVIVEGHGAQQFRRAFPGVCETIFLMPPNESELRRRLASRGDSPTAVEERLRLVAKEMIYAVEADHTIQPGTPDEVLRRVIGVVWRRY
jgi:guanylate kinase